MRRTHPKGLGPIDQLGRGTRASPLRDMIAIDLTISVVQRCVHSVGHRRRQPQADRGHSLSR
jgi:hypothetical protein